MFATRTDSLQAALASIAVRMDGLSNTMALLRTVVSDRLTDYGEQVVRAQAANDREMEDYRRLQERSVVELQTGLGESEHALRRLERSVAAVAADLDKTGRVVHSQLEQLEHLGRRLEDVAGLAAQHPEPDLSPIEDQLQSLGAQVEALLQRAEPSQIDITPLTGAVEYVQDQLDILVEKPQPADVDLNPVHDQLQHLHTQLDALTQRPQPADVDLTPLHDQLQHLHTQLDALTQRPEVAMPDIEVLLGDIRSRLEALAAPPDTSSTDVQATEVAAALERLELAVATRTSGRPLGDEHGAEVLRDLDERVGRLAAAQAEDLERLLDAIEEFGSRQGAVQDEAAAVTARLEADVAGRAELTSKLAEMESTRATQTDAISRLGSAVEAQSKATAKVATAVSQLGSQLESRLDALEQGTNVGPGEEGIAEILDRLQTLSDQTQMLRRRIALRARTDQGIDPAVVDAVADAVAERLFVDRAEDEPDATGRRRGRRA